jgi:hypothetical protein
MTRPRTQHRTWWQRLLVMAAVILTVWLPTSPAAAAPGDLCYVGSGKPVEQQPPNGLDAPQPTYTAPVARCDDLTAYTRPSTFFSGSDSTIIDSQGNELDAYYFDSGYRGVIDSATHADVKLATMVADWILAGVKMIVWLACWLLGIAINFGVADALLGPAEQAAQGYQTQVVDRFGLPNLALMLCVFWFGLMALRGRVGKGWGEILISFCLAALSGVVLAAPASTVLGDDGLLGNTRDFGITLAALPLDDPDDPTTNTGHITPNNIITPFQTSIIDVFVRQPHQQLAYGAVFDDTGDGKPHPCLDTYNKILKTELEDDEAPMYDLMEECDPRLAEHLRRSPGGRIGGSLMVLVSALVMLGFVLTGVVIPLIGGQIGLAGLAVLLVIALPVSLLGGYGRRALWLWVSSAVTVLAVMLVGFVLMSAFLVGTKALTAIEGTGFLLRLLLVVIAAIVLLACHRRIRHSATSHVRFAARRLDRAKIGGSGMGGMGMGGRSWSVRGVWRDVSGLGASVQGAARDFRRGFNQGRGAGGGYRRGSSSSRGSSAAVCHHCGGTGTVSVYLQSTDDWEDRECPTCNGTGNP